jgi:hypothetical protein
VCILGLEVFDELKTSSNRSRVYVECGSATESAEAVAAKNPDVIILNQHPLTMPWASLTAHTLSDLPTIGIVHDATDEIASRWEGPHFDVLVAHEEVR